MLSDILKVGVFEAEVMTERSSTGTFTSTVSAADVLDLFDAVEGPVLGSGDVAENLHCTRDTARRKLDVLEDRGLVASRMVGRTKVFWPVNRSRDLRDWAADQTDSET